jgi:hypothetical protein
MSVYRKGSRNGLEDIARKAARVFAGRDWHRLSEEEQELVEKLKREGYLSAKQIPDGVVGRAVIG